MNRMTSIAASTAIVGAGLMAGSGLATAGESYDKGDRSGYSQTQIHYHTHVTESSASQQPRTGLVGGLLGGLGGTVDGVLGV